MPFRILFRSWASTILQHAAKLHLEFTTTWRTTIHLMWLQFEFPSHLFIQLKQQKMFLENLSRWLWIYCGKYSHRYVYQLSQQGWCFATWMMFLQQCMFNNALSSICTLAIFQCCAWTERALFMIRFLYVSKKFDSSLTNVHHVVTQSAKAAELHSTTGKRGVLL
jgi:hypothetical protein